MDSYTEENGSIETFNSGSARVGFENAKNLSRDVATDMEEFNSEINSLEIEQSTLATLEINRKRKPATVMVRNAFKSFGEGTPILNNFNMTVPNGSIYSLLGSSGCGKTTLLSCVVGTKQLNSGDIKVFGYKPGTKESGVPGKRVGYMPQEYALYNDFSISEILNYFGKLFGMEESDIKTSGDFLVDFLELPDCSRRIGCLSGGQKRRVSLAVALIHSPELLILDEPTVGVDPLLRENIWSHLVKLVSCDNTTVIITTHYIEEARSSDTIGLMRDGRLITEQSPSALLKMYNNTNVLEDIVLKLCKKQAMGHPLEEVTVDSKAIEFNRKPSQVDYESINNSRRVSWVPPKSFYQSTDGISESLNRIWALVIKNKVVMTRNLLLLIFIIMVLPLETLIIGFAIGHDPKPINVGFVNHETNLSSSCLSMPRDRFQDGCFIEDMSCQFLFKLPKDTVNLFEYETEELAQESIRKGKTWGFMIFPSEFSNSFASRAASCNKADNKTLIGSKILLQLDMSNAQVGPYLKHVVYNTYRIFTRDILTSCGFDPKLIESPIQYLKPIYGKEDIDFKNYSTPSVMLGVLFFITLSTSGIAIIYDKKQGTLERARVAGVQNYEILIAFFITGSLLCIIEGTVLILQTGLGFCTMVFVTGITVEGSVVLALCLIFIVGLSGVSMGFMISSFCTEEIQAVLLALAAFMPNVMLSGIFWPSLGMPNVLRYIGLVLPCTLAAESLRSIISRGWGFSHINVWPGFLSTFGWILIYWATTILVHRIVLKNK